MRMILSRAQDYLISQFFRYQFRKAKRANALKSLTTVGTIPTLRLVLRPACVYHHMPIALTFLAIRHYHILVALLALLHGTYNRTNNCKNNHCYHGYYQDSNQ